MSPSPFNSNSGRPPAKNRDLKSGVRLTLLGYLLPIPLASPRDYHFSLVGLLLICYPLPLTSSATACHGVPAVLLSFTPAYHRKTFIVEIFQSDGWTFREVKNFIFSSHLFQARKGESPTLEEGLGGKIAYEGVKVENWGFLFPFCITFIST